MPRYIRVDQILPFKIEPKDFPPDGKSIWICACGLTRTWPYCDKSHKACAGEDPARTYVYDDQGSRRECSEPPSAPSGGTGSESGID